MRRSSYPSCPPTQYARVRQGDEGTLEDKYRGRQIPPRKTNFRRTAAIRAREPPCNKLTVDTAAAVALLVYSVAPLGGGIGPPFPVLGEASPGGEMQKLRLACDKSTRSVHAINEHGRES